MALVLADRVRDTTTTTGTGAVTLSGSPPSGYQAFSKVGDGNTTYYTISGGGQWEVGIGTYTASSTSLSRDTVLDSSNSGSLVNFSAGTKDVFVTYPAGESVYQDGTAIRAGTSYLGVANGGTGAATLTSNALLKGNGTSAISASSITDNGTLVTIAEPVRLSTPNTSSAAWTTSGINLIQSAATFTDTSSTGTVANVYMNRFNAQTLAATNTITATNLYGVFFNSPIAGTNVTASNPVWAVGAESARITGSVLLDGTVTASGGLTFTGPTTTSTSAFATGTTSSGSTKTVNIGTGGASGSTTAITLGSATSGATQTTTVNGQVTLAPIGGSAAAWTTSGIALKQSAATWTDTSSTGTVAAVRMNNFAAQTLAASNAITVTNFYGTYFNNPVAGTNVTSNGTWALGADSIWTSGALVGAGGNFVVSSIGTLTAIGGTGSVTHSLATATTASGSTKTVNIGTGGASGSTTAITLGSSTSGATQTTTINGRVTLAPIGASAAAWTTSGIALTQSAATWTDTSSTGTVADIRVNNFAAQTVAASNVITATNLFGTYFANPVSGTNVTATNPYAVGIDSLYVGATLNVNSGSSNVTIAPVAGLVNIGGSAGTGTISVGRSTATQTLNLHGGVTASGSTKTVNLGTGGASGSTTNITIGSSTSGATSTLTLEGTMSDPAIIYANSPGFRGLPQNAKTGAYTLALTDAGKHISITTGGITVPANGSVAFPIGTTIVIYNDSASSQNIAITTDTMYLAGTATTGTRALAQRGLATLVKVASTTWVCSGPGVT